MRIEIKNIPHKDQRVGEVGDYWDKKGKTIIAISKMREEYMQAVALHELVEYFLIKNRGIKLEDIDNFDKEYYNNGNIGEAGNSESAPYYTEHLFATKIEKMFCEELGINWEEYALFIDNL